MIVHPLSVVPSGMIPKCLLSVWVIASLIGIFLAYDSLRSNGSDERRENAYAALGALGIGIVSLLIGEYLS